MDYANICLRSELRGCAQSPWIPTGGAARPHCISLFARRIFPLSQSNLFRVIEVYIIDVFNYHVNVPFQKDYAMVVLTGLYFKNTLKRKEN